MDSGMSTFLQSTNKSIQIVITLDIVDYIRTEYTNSSFSPLSKLFTEIPGLNIRSKGLVGGIYLLVPNISMLEEEPKLIELYMRLSENSPIPVGVYLKTNCATQIQNLSLSPFLKKS